MSEALEMFVQMGAVEGSQDISVIGIKPPLRGKLAERREALLNDSRFYDLRSNLGECMLDIQPYNGPPYTKIDCDELAKQLFSEERLILEPRNVAREIAAFLAEGDEVTVHFDRDVKQLPPGHHLFAGQTR